MNQSTKQFDERDKTIFDLKRILLQLRRNYPIAIREAWIEGFETGVGKPEDSREHSGNHYANSNIRKQMKETV